MGDGEVVWACENATVPNKISKTEEYNLLTFSGIFSPPNDLNFP